MNKWTYNKYLKRIINRTENQEIKEKQITIHNLRHSIATHLLEQGIPVEQVRMFLRAQPIRNHSDLHPYQQTTTKRTDTMKLEEYLQKEYSSTSISGYENMIIRFKLTLGDEWIKQATRMF